MKPFNLEAALNGAPVITRDGRAVKIAGYNPEAKDGKCIVGWADNEARAWRAKGKAGWFENDETPSDLFMAPTERTEWVLRCPKTNQLYGPYKDCEKAEADAENWKFTIHPITITE